MGIHTSHQSSDVDTIAKAFVKMITARLASHLKHRIAATQYATKGRSLDGNIFYILQLCEQWHEVEDDVLLLLFVD